MKKFLTPFLVVSLLIISGCTSANPPENEEIVCTQEYKYGLTIMLKDEQGNAIQNGKITVLSGKTPDGDRDFVQTEAGGTYVGLGEGEGDYELLIEKVPYETKTLSVHLDHDQCHVIPQVKEVILKAIS